MVCSYRNTFYNNLMKITIFALFWLVVFEFMLLNLKCPFVNWYKLNCTIKLQYLTLAYKNLLGLQSTLKLFILFGIFIRYEFNRFEIVVCLNSVYDFFIILNDGSKFYQPQIKLIPPICSMLSFNSPSVS